MMGKGRRRGKEVGVFKGKKTMINTGNVFHGFDILKVDLEKTHGWEVSHCLGFPERT